MPSLMISLGEALDRVTVERFGKQVTDLIEKCIVVLFWCPSLIGFLGGHLLAQYWNSGFVDITMVMLFLEVYLGNYHNMSFFFLGLIGMDHVFFLKISQIYSWR